MNPNSEFAPVLTLAGEGQPLRAFGDELTVLLSGEQTGGKYAMILYVTPPGGGPPPHWHDNEDEMFFVLEGRASFFANNQWTEVPHGSSAFLPRGSVHTFKNVGDKPLKMVLQVAPAGFEVFFSKCAAEFAKLDGPNMNQILATANEHGIHFAQP